MRRIAGCLLGFAIVGALACSDGPEITDTVHLQIDGAALFSEACSNCHSLAAPISAASSVTRADEAWTLVRACVPYGLTLTDDEEAAIVEYLLSHRKELRG